MSSMKKKFDEYYLGLDIGTDSVGWAVTNTKYEILRFNSKAMWGIRLFEGGKTAESRRLHRSATRRLQRRKQRINLLQELFSDEISKVDPGFYHRMSESKYWPEDKDTSGKYALFNDNSFTDSEHHMKFKTIYHLRDSLLNWEADHDIRHLYLGIHHIIKNRGHFLFEGQEMESVSDFRNVFNEFLEYVREEEILEDFTVSPELFGSIAEIVKSRKYSTNDKKRRLLVLFDRKDAVLKECVNALAGGTVKTHVLFENEELKDSEVKSFKFSDAGFDETRDSLEDLVDEKILLVDKLKAIYDWGVLTEILKGEKYLSSAKVRVYETHSDDLKLLKTMTRKYANESFESVFVSGETKGNYASYVGMSKKNGKKIVVNDTCTQEDLCKYLKKVFSGVTPENDSQFSDMMARIENNDFMPKQVDKSNSVIPYQVHLMELEKILSNAEKRFDFLLEKDENDLSVSDKIKKIFTFRIPYYVGPLNDAHRNKGSNGGNCWIEKKVDKKILPWNFEEVVDLEQSSENFIRRMTNKCTYLVGEDVLPKNSLLYSEYMVLNEINNLRVNGEIIDKRTKDVVFDLFRMNKKVSVKRIKATLQAEGMLSKDDELTGVDIAINSSMGSYVDFEKIVGDRLKRDDYKEKVENIIKWIVLFGDDKKLLKNRLNKEYSNDFSQDELKKILRLRYTGWGRLSEKLLTEIYHTEKTTGEMFSIIGMLRETQTNLMKLLSNNYDYSKEIEKHNHNMNMDYDPFSYETVKEMYVSPSVKRGIWQTMEITKEIVKITGKPPKKIFLEVARGAEAEPKRKSSRKARMEELYKSIKDNSRDWIKEIGDKSESEFRSSKLFLYYTQMGKCMYSGEKIELSNLFNNNLYDIDHIYPRSLVKDDSLNNRVLVKKEINAKKTDVYPVDSEIRTKMHSFWQYLFSKELIDKTKLDRLTRSSGFTADELAGFINRQLVETRQSSKAVAQLIKNAFPDTNVVYVKAGNVSDFRKQYDIIKVREINDYHHAKDAYLNIVVGNVYDTKFTQSPANFIKQRDFTYNLRRMYDFDVSRNGYMAWKRGNAGTIETVRKFARRNNILFTRYATETKGELFKLLPLKKGYGQLSLKSSDPRMTIEKYGGYDKISGAYFTLVEHTKKGKRVRSLEFVPVHLKTELEKSGEKLNEYFRNKGLSSPKVIIAKVKFNTLFEIDGFPMHITGRTNNDILYKGAQQLLLPERIEKNIKMVLKLKEKGDTEKILEKTSLESNLELFDAYVSKLKDTKYSIRLGAQISNLQKGREVFKSLSPMDQLTQLTNILNLFTCNPVKTDLSLIRGPKTAGTVKTSNEMSKFKSAYIIHQSPTGLFEKRINLLEIGK